MLGTCLQSMQFVSQEMILAKRNLDIFRCVGQEGMWGFTFYLAILTLMQTLPGDGSNLCNLFVENSAFAFQQISASPTLLALTLVGILDISLFNFFGVTIVKHASASHRATVDLLRMLFVWIFSVLFGLEAFEPLLVPGFVTLTIGFLIFNEILVLPFAGLDAHVQARRAKPPVSIEIQQNLNMSKNDSLMPVTRLDMSDDQFRRVRQTQ